MTLHRVGGIIRLATLDLPTLLKIQPDVLLEFWANLKGEPTLNELVVFFG
jgi:hypothetical protein